MRRFLSAVGRGRGWPLGAVLGVSGLMGGAQNSTAPARPTQPAAVASLGDSLLAKATTLYDSTAKSGLHGFDCEVHPDWKTIMSSSRKGAAGSDDDPRLALVSAAEVALHARLGGGSTLGWKTAAGRSPDPSDQALLERAHRGIENTLLGVLKLWIPLVDGSVAESLGEGGNSITATDRGYTLRSADKALTEEFDRNLLLTRYVATDAGARVDIAPRYVQGPHGLQLASFAAQIAPAGAGEGGGQQMNVGVDYQSVSGMQIPSAINIDVADVVTMNFRLDGCVVNPAP